MAAPDSTESVPDVAAYEVEYERLFGKRVVDSCGVDRPSGCSGVPCAASDVSAKHGWSSSSK
jgi:hypothetical protein